MSETATLRRWHVGTVDDVDEGGTGVIALTADDRDRARADVVRGLSELAGPMEVPRAEEVVVRLPPYRGMRLVPLLAWLVTERLAAPGALVTWTMTKQQGPASVLERLAGHGWSLRPERAPDKRVVLRGHAPASNERPTPRSFRTDLGACRDLELFADYGVFSPDRVDDGTRLLLDVALTHEPVPVVADIGTGYGALAIGLVGNGVAGSAVATDVDALALWLADRNAQAHGVELTTVMSADPQSIPPTDLTVCNVPTHISADASRRLMAGLAARARHGILLIVVHASLEHRYARHLDGLGPLTRHPGAEHVVVGTGT